MMLIKKNNKVEKIEIFFFLTCIIVIVVLGGVCAYGKAGLWIEDEFGYLGVPALLNGFSWKDLYTELGYYGFGYGLLFIPAFLICNSAKQLMTYIMVINISLIVGCFILSVRLLKNIFKEIELIPGYLLGLIVTLYINNLAQLQMAWSESLNLFLYWLALNTYYDLITKKRTREYIIFSLVQCILIMVHMRNIAVVLPCILMLVCSIVSDRKINIRNILFFGIVAVVGAFIFLIVKNYIQVNLYNVTNSNQSNDIKSTLASYNNMFDIQYIELYWKGFFAKLFYILSSTLGIIGLGILYVINIISKEDNREKKLVSYLALLIFFTSYAIGITNTLAPVRVDTMFYGRYFEVNIGFILIVGIYYLVHVNEKRTKYMSLWAIIILYKISFLISENFFRESIPYFKGAFTFPCVTGIAKYFFDNPIGVNIIGEIFFSTIIRICLLVLTVLLLGNKKKILCAILTIYLVFIQFNDAYIVIDEMKYYQNQRYLDVDSIADAINLEWNEAEKCKIYYYYGKIQEEVQANILALQFKLGRTPIEYIEGEELDLNNTGEDMYVILNKNDNNYELKKKKIWEMGGEQLSETNLFDLYLLRVKSRLYER